MISVRLSEPLLRHLQEFEVDGAAVASVLFSGGRLSYPERRRMEHELGFTEPYLLEHECRVLEGMSPQWNAACRFLARIATHWAVGTTNPDPTLELLWESHDAFAHSTKDAGAQALDRLIAALVTVQNTLQIRNTGTGSQLSTLVRACEILIRGLEIEGFPPSGMALEEICDGAPPACVGLGLVDIDWKEERCSR